MVVGAFPVAKLGTLLIRQISKPIAGYIKQSAKKSYVFRTWICLPVAQFYHRCETRYKLWILGLGKPTKITPLNEQMAVELGGDILGEVIIFTIAGTLLTAEYVRSLAKAKAHEEDQERRLHELESKLLELDLQCEQQRAQMRELERRVYASPLRAIKEKLIPSSSGSSSGGQSSSTTSSGGDQQPQSSVSQSSGSSSSGSISPKANSSGGEDVRSTTADSGISGTVLNSSKASAAMLVTATAAADNDLGTAPAVRDDDGATSSGRGYATKVIRRAVKILLNTYEEVYDDD